jgi:hypothetical protein
MIEEPGLEEGPGLSPINKKFQKKSENFKPTISVRNVRKII